MTKLCLKNSYDIQKRKGRRFLFSQNKNVDILKFSFKSKNSQFLHQQNKDLSIYD